MNDVEPNSKKRTDGGGQEDWMSRALAYIRSNSHRNIRLADVAGQAGRSAWWFQQQIRARTGRTFTTYLLGIRMEEARRLLAETSLPIGRIAPACGFASAAYFARVFRRESGMPPRRYRDLHRPPTPPPPEPEAGRERRVIFDEPFSPRSLGTTWVALAGRWEARNGILSGESREDLYVALNEELPADFLLELELMRRAEPRREPRMAVVVAISDGTAHRRRGYLIRLGDNSNSSHRFTRMGRTMAMEQGLLADGVWHVLRLHRNAGSITLSLDGRELVRYRELVPLRRVDSRRLVVGGWDATILLRRPSLLALPSASKTSAIALADELMAEGDCARALEIYEGELEKEPHEPGQTDLLFKIGMCFVGLGLKLRARGYLERFAARRTGDIWGIVAQLESLRARMEDLRGGDLEAEVGRLLEVASSPGPSDLLLDFLLERSGDMAEQGDFEKAVLLSRLTYAASPPLSEQADRAARALVNDLFSCYRYADALRFVRDTSSSGRLNNPQVRRLRLESVQSLAALGRVRAALEELRATDEEDAFVRSHAEILRAQVCQARGDLGGALGHYLRLTRNPGAPQSQSATAASCAAAMLALAGEWKEASDLAGTLSRWPDPGIAMYVRWSLCVLRRAYGEMLPVLEERTYRVGGGKDAIRENLLLCILHELAGEAERSARNLEVLWRRYRRGAPWRWVLPAAFLLGEASEEQLWHDTRGFCLFSPFQGSSSLFYMLGLVMKGRGRRANAQQLFRLAVKADPLNYWPALLARKELGMLTPKMKKYLGGR